MIEKDLTLLRCPVSGKSLEIEEIWKQDGDEILLGTLRGPAREYLIFDGVPLFDGMPGTARAITQRILPLLKSGEEHRIDTVLARHHPAIHALRRLPEDATLDDFFKHWFRRRWRFRKIEEQPSGREYLEWRTANTSYFAALALIPFLKGPLIMDFGCGAGHFSHLAGRFFPDARIVACDALLINLLVKRRFFRPRTGDLDVVIDANQRLPFTEGMVSSVLSVDCLHYVRNQAGCIREIRRILSPGAPAVFSHLHHRRNEAAPEDRHFPHDLRGWKQIFDLVGAVPAAAGFDDAVLMKAAMGNHESEPASLSARDGSRAESFSFVLNARLESPWPRMSIRDGAWCINPAYAIRRGKSGWRLTRRRPPSRIEREVCAQALPEHYTLGASSHASEASQAERHHILQPCAPLAVARERLWKNA